MSATDTRSSSGLVAGCIQCGLENSAEAKFCSGCGAPLWDQCPSCNVPARKGQKFCGGCGFNLVEDFDKRRANAEAWVQRSAALLAENQFADAYSLAVKLAGDNDPRLAELRQRANKIAEEAESQRTHWETHLAGILETVHSAAEKRDYEKVMDLMEGIPESILETEQIRLRNSCRQQLKEVRSLTERFDEAVEGNDFMGAGVYAEQLLSLQPENPKYHAMASKVGKALVASAKKRFSAGQYAEALARLDATPTVARGDKEYDAVRMAIDDTSWLTEQIARSPFATPVLGRLVQRLVKVAPHDTRAPKLLQQLAVKVKEGSKNPRSLFGSWVGSATGWGGAPAAILSWPQKIDYRNVPIIKQNPTRFCIAIGLALQGLGLAEFKESFIASKKGGGLGRLLGRKKTSPTAWGIDVGSSAIRAVKLEKQGDKVVVTEAYWLGYDQPLCRTGLELKASVLQREKLDELAPKINAEPGVPVWAALPSWESLGRFVSLPPLKDKVLSKLLEQELQSQFPIPLDKLSSMTAMSGTGADGSPRAILVAAKKDAVEQREKAFEEAGIKLAGLQAEPLALHNYLRYDMSEYFETPDEMTATPDAICLIDAGAAGVTMYLGTRESFWFRYMDGGGEDLTAKVAGAEKKTHRDAEPLKQNPVELGDLAGTMEILEARMSQAGMRLDQHYQQALQFVGDIKLKHVFCTGGTALMHGWVRYVLAKAGKV